MTGAFEYLRRVPRLRLTESPPAAARLALMLAVSLRRAVSLRWAVSLPVALAGCGGPGLGPALLPGWNLEGSGTDLTLAGVGPGIGIPSTVLFAEGDATPPDRLVLRWSGTAWEPSLWPRGIGCLTCKTPRSVTVEGTAFNLAGGVEVQRFDKTKGAWITEKTPAAGTLQALGGFDFRHVWAVDDKGGTVRFDGSVWTRVPTPTSKPLRAVWAAKADEAYAVGDGGTTLHFLSGAWIEEPSGTTARLLDAWGPSSKEVYAVGERGTILHRIP